MQAKPVILIWINFTLAITVRLNVFGQSANNQIKPAEEERSISPFHTLHVSGLAVVYLSRTGDTNKAELVVSGMPIKEVLTTVKEGILTVTTEGIHKGENVKVYVRSSILKSISVSGAGILYSQDTVKADKLSISVIGVGAAQLTVGAKELEINMNGGDLKISGLTKSNKINYGKDHDRGTLDMSDLTVEN